MNLVVQLSQKYSYPQIVERIRATTGRRYSVGHIGNVARGSQRMSDSLEYNLLRAFPEFFLPTNSVAVQVVLENTEKSV
jgi:hypothetical protein